MKRLFFISLAAVAMLTSAASALTLQQAQQELAGMHCSGSSCTSSQTVVTTVQNPDITTTVQNPDVVTTTDNPDIVTSTTTVLDPGASGGQNGGNPFSTGKGCTMTTMDHKVIPATGVNADCVANSIVYVGWSRPAVTRTDTKVTDGGTTTTTTPGGTTTVVTPGGTTAVSSCDTTTKTLTYNGPNTDRAGAWSVTTDHSSSDGAC